MTESYEVKKQECRVCYHQGGDGKRYSPDRKYSVKCFHCNGLGYEFINAEDNLRIPLDTIFPVDMLKFISLLRARFLAHEDVDLYNAINDLTWKHEALNEKVAKLEALLGQAEHRITGLRAAEEQIEDRLKKAETEIYDADIRMNSIALTSGNRNKEIENHIAQLENQIKSLEAASPKKCYNIGGTDGEKA